MSTESATSSRTYVKICEYDGAEPIDVPTDKENRLLIQTIKRFYPDAVGLRYVSLHGTMRFLETDLEFTYFFPPESGYQDNIFYLVFPKKAPSTVPKDLKASVEEKTGSQMNFLPTNHSKMKKWYTEVQLLNRLRVRELGIPLAQKYDLCERNRQQTLYQKDVKGHYGCVNAVEFSPKGTYIVSGGDDLRVILWKAVDFLTQDQPKPFQIMKSKHFSNIFALDFSLGTERIYSAGNDHTLFVHDIATGESSQSYSADRCFYGISIHPHDDNVFAAASEDGRVRIYDLRNSEECHAIKQPGPVFCGEYNPVQSNLMCVCGSKMGLTVYDHRMLKEAFASAGSFTQHAIHGDWNDRGDAIFCIRSKSKPLVFDLHTSNHIELNDLSYENICTVKSCTFLNSQYVMTGGDDWNIYIWKVPERIESIDEAFTVLKGHRSIVNHIRYSEENNMIVSCGVEKILKVWSGMPINQSYRDPPRRQPLSMSQRRAYSYLDEVDNVEEDLNTLHMFDSFTHHEDMENEMELDLSDDDDDREADGLLHGYIFRFAHHGEEDYNEVVLSSNESSDTDMDRDGDSSEDDAGFQMFES